MLPAVPGARDDESRLLLPLVQLTSEDSCVQCCGMHLALHRCTPSQAHLGSCCVALQGGQLPSQRRIDGLVLPQSGMHMSIAPCKGACLALRPD